MTETKEESKAVAPEEQKVEPVATKEEVSSPEVKVEEASKTAPESGVDPEKLREQVENLNAALKQEREDKKALKEEFSAKFDQSQQTIDKLKSVFVEEQEETTTEELTIDKVEELLEERDRKRKEEQIKEAQAVAIKTEISKLEREWDGSDGKPKYDDKAVLDWQESNEKLHLSPEEAFNEMNRDAIIDWEIKNRMSKKPTVENVETPGAVSAETTTTETKPKTAEELKNALLDAMGVADNENIN